MNSEIILDTPRRSSRLNKGAMLAPDYEQIISRSASKAVQNDEQIVKQVWTPKSVGRISMKRRRKSTHCRKTLIIDPEIENAYDLTKGQEVQKLSPLCEVISGKEGKAIESDQESQTAENKSTDSSIITIDDSIVSVSHQASPVLEEQAINKTPALESNQHIAANINIVTSPVAAVITSAHEGESPENLNTTFDAGCGTQRKSDSNIEAEKTDSNSFKITTNFLQVPSALQVNFGETPDGEQHKEATASNILLATPVQNRKSKIVNFNSASKVVSSAARKTFKTTPHKPDYSESAKLQASPGSPPQIEQQIEMSEPHLTHTESEIGANLELATPADKRKSKKVIFNSTSKVVSSAARKTYQPTPHKLDFVTRRKRSVGAMKSFENLLEIDPVPVKQANDSEQSEVNLEQFPLAGQNENLFAPQPSKTETLNTNVVLATPVDKMKSRKVNFSSASKVVSFTSKLFAPTPHKPGFQTRRQRSRSLTESSTSALIKVTITPNKIMIPSQASNKKSLIKRTKLPNFEAIHKRNEERSENVVDYLARKENRFKVLTASSTKAKLAPSQEEAAPTEHTKLANVSALPRPVKVPDIATRRELPKPTILPQPVKRPATTATKTSAAKRANLGLAMHSSTARQAAPPVKRAAQKELFNADAKNTTIHTSRFQDIMPKTSDTKNTSMIPIRYQDKIAARQEKHKQMFKSNASQSARRQKERDLSHMVRSNRRFDLQMEYRRQKEATTSQAK